MNEADARGLELGRREGEAFGRTLKRILEDVADGGEEIAHGDYLIAYAFEKAEGMYIPRDGKLEWTAPERENIHIEIAVRNRADGRLLPQRCRRQRRRHAQTDAAVEPLSLSLWPQLGDSRRRNSTATTRRTASASRKAPMSPSRT
jgi:hypothetical protein